MQMILGFLIGFFIIPVTLFIYRQLRGYFVKTEIREEQKLSLAEEIEGVGPQTAFI